MSTPAFPAEPRPLWKDLLHPAVIVGALGYFVDIYDLTLFMTCLLYTSPSPRDS